MNVSDRHLQPTGRAGCVAVLWAVAVAACGCGKPQQAQSPPPPAVNVTVQVVRPRAHFTDTFLIPGSVEPNRTVRVCAEVDGRIESINGTEGTPVTRGQKLVVLNSELLAAEVSRARSQVQTSKVDLARMEKLYTRQPPLATETELDQARNNLAVNQAAYDTAASRFERSTIVAPIFGQLNSLPMEEGEYAMPGSCVAEIVDIETAKVVVDVPERDVAHLSEGDQAEVFVGIETRQDDSDDAPERTIPGRITYISRLADNTALTTRTEISVPNGEGTGTGGRGRALRSGQIVRVKLTREELRNVIFVPLSSVIPLEKNYRVYVVEDGRAQDRTVTLGMIKQAEVQVLSGLQAGDQLIVLGQQYVGPGQEVKIEKTEDSANPAAQTAPADAPTDLTR